jgi:quercetin dioxygenase-like cupin family protein
MKPTTSSGTHVRAKEMSVNELLKRIPAAEGVRKIGVGEGEKFDVAGAHFVWKVKADDSAYSFSVNELTLAPGESVPVHGHTSAECFYVLAGEAHFFRVKDGKEDWVRAITGELMMLPPNALHGFFNLGDEACCLLGVSTAVHQTFFDAVLKADRESSFATMALPEAMGKIGAIALENHMYFPPVPCHASRRRREVIS